MPHVWLVGIVLLVALSCAGQTKALLDNFNHRFLDPNLWYPYPACTAGADLEMECIRSIEYGQLRLAHRSFGQQDSDSGSQLGWSIGVINHAETINVSVTADLVVRSVEEVPCAANPGIGGHADIWASFFNAGSGVDSNDDVGAQIVFGRLAFDPPGQLTVNAQVFHGNDYSIDFVTLGTIPIGTPVTATVAWDRPNHRFLVKWTNRITHKTTAAPLPYTFSYTAPPVNPTKMLQVVAFPANCTANQTSVYVDALFDNVYIVQ